MNNRAQYERLFGKGLQDKLQKFPVYGDLEPHYAHYLYNKFIGQVESIYLVSLSASYPNNPKIYPNKNDIYTIVEQVWKRKVYFRVFHKDVHGMNELKEAALYCFWVLKLQPFHLTGCTDSMNKLNAKIALRLLISGALTYTKNMNEKSLKEAIANKRTTRQNLTLSMSLAIANDLFYSFQFRDWSKESLMDLCAGMIIVEQIAVAP